MPQKGDKHHLVQLAMKNAELSYQKERDADEQQQRALEELQDKLHLQEEEWVMLVLLSPEVKEELRIKLKAPRGLKDPAC